MPLELRIACDAGNAQYMHGSLAFDVPVGTTRTLMRPTSAEVIWQFYVWCFGSAIPIGPTQLLAFGHWQEGVQPHGDPWVHSVTPWTPIITKNGVLNGDPLSIDPIEELYLQANSPVNVLKENGQTFEVKTLSTPLYVYDHGKGVQHWSRVVKIHRHTYTGEILRINTTSGVVDVSPSHSLVKANGEDVRGDQVKVGDKLAAPGLAYLPSKSDGLFIGPKELAWLYGLFAAEGCSYGPERPKKGGNQAGAHVYNKDKDLLEKAQNIYEENFHRESNIREKDDGVHQLEFYGYRVRDFFNQFYTIHREKRVPSLVLNAPSEVKKTFLEGYYAGDGSTQGHGDSMRQSFTTTSQILAQGVMFLQYVLDGNSFNVTVENGNQDALHINVNKGGSPSKIIRNVSGKKGEFTESFNIGQRKPRGLIKKIFRIPFEDGWLYDLETESTKFCAGVGSIRVHNSLVDFEYPIWANCTFQNPHYITWVNRTGAIQTVDFQYHLAVFATREKYWLWYCDLILLGLRNSISDFLLSVMSLTRPNFEAKLEARREDAYCYKSTVETLLTQQLLKGGP